MKLETSINHLQFQKYSAYLKSQGLSDATVKRKLSSLSSFQKFLIKKKFLNPNLRSDNLTSEILAPPSDNLRSDKLTSGNLFSKFSFRTYMVVATILILLSGLGYTVYSQTILQARKNLAYSTAASLTTPNRILSFQGRLTDSSGNPITSSTGIVFRLFNSDVGGTELYVSNTGNSQTVIPDENGIFSVVIGKSHGAGVPSTVFSENAEVWLEITAAGETMDPRQQIATVGYALNAETLQGLPPSASGEKDTVVIVDGLGNINLGETSPSIISTSGTFGLEGQAILIKATDGSGGNITINPDGAGILKLITEGAGSTAVGGFIEATNANLATGNLFSGLIRNDNRGYNFIDFTNYDIGTTTLSSRFSVDASGTVTTSIGITAPKITLSVGASTGYILQSDANGNSTWVSPGSAGIGTSYDAGSGLTRTGSVFKFGGAVTENTRLNIGNTEVLYINSANGNVGLGTTSPTYKLTIAAGDIALDNTKNIYWGSGATQSYLNVNSGFYRFYYNATERLKFDLNASSVHSILDMTANLALGTSAANTDLIFNPNRNAYMYSGNFGLGTTSPTYKLEVVGSNNIFRIGDTAGNTLFSVTDSAITSNLPTSFNSSGDVSMAYNLIFTNPTQSTIKSSAPLSIEAGEVFGSSNLSLKTYNSGNVIVDSQKLVIGGTLTYSQGASNGYILQSDASGNATWVTASGIGGTYTATNGLTLTGSAFGLGGTLTQNTQIGTSSFGLSFLGLGGTQSLFIGSSGFVGIGTTSQAYRLNVNGDIYMGNNGLFYFGESDLTFDRQGSNTVRFSSNGRSRMSFSDTLIDINSSGTPVNFRVAGISNPNSFFVDSTSENVGIGTSAPSKKLDITGDINLTGTIFSNGTSGTSGQVLSSTGTGLQWVNAASVGGTYVFSNGLTNNGTFIGLGGTLIQNTNLTIGNTSVLFIGGTSGYVGIGTTNPGGVFDVTEGTAQFQILANYANPLYRMKGGNYLARFSYASTDSARLDLYTGGTITNHLDTNGASYFNGGNVGIGTTAPEGKSHIVGAAGFYPSTSGSSQNGLIQRLQNNDSNLVLDFGGYGANGAWLQATNRTNLASNFSLLLNPNGGNVGIGTTAPSKKLDVVGDINLTGTIFSNGTSGTSGQVLSSTGTGLQWVNASSVGGTYVFNNGLTNNGTFIGLGGTLTQNTNLTVGNTSVLFLGTNGNVGLGTTNPLTQLELNSAGNTSFTGSVRSSYLSLHQPSNSSRFMPIDFLYDTSNLPVGRIAVQPSSSGSNMLFGVSTNYASGINSIPLFLQYNGNVGIGTTNPTQKLTITGSGPYQLGLDSSNTRGGIYLSEGGIARGYFGLGDSGDIFTGASLNSISLRSEGDLHLGGTGDNLTMTLKNNLVGIGTTSPSKKLDIAGDINLTGTIFSNGTSGTSGQVLSSTGTGLQWVNASSVGGTYVFNNGLTNYGSFVGLGGTLTQDVRLNIGNTEVLFLKNSNGYVGIGTTNPTSPFTVNGGNGLFSVDTNGNAAINQTNISVTTFGLQHGTDSNFLLVANNSGNFRIYDAKNSAYRTTIDGSGNFGIGPSSPATLFDVNRLFNVTSSGNVGIGTTNPTYKLHISGDAQAVNIISMLQNVNATTPTHLYNIVDNAGSRTNYAAGIYGISGGYPISAGVDANVGYTIKSNTNNYLSIINGGNVGIGTTAPSKKLDIVGDINLTGTIFSNGTSGTSGQVLSSTGTGLQWVNAASVGGTYVFSNGLTNNGTFVGLGGTLTQDVRLNIGNTEVLFLKNSNGYVGIGTTNPGYKFQVQGAYSDLYFDGGPTAVLGTNYGSGANISLYHASTGQMTISSYAGTLFNTNGSTKMIISNAGNVGIGTTAPSANLHIWGNSSQYLKLETASTGYAAFQAINGGGVMNIGRNNSTGGALTYGAPYGGMVSVGGTYPLQFGTNDTARMTIDGTGNVGIGTTNPLSALDVVGKITIGTVGSDQIYTNSLSAKRAANGFLVPLITYDTAENMYVGNAGGNYMSKLFLRGGGGDVSIISNGTTEAFIVKYATGNVGIGTTSPLVKLQINGPNATVSPSTINGGLILQGQGDVVMTAGIDDNVGNFWIQPRNKAGPTNYYPTLINPIGGNVGIGTTNPGAKLEIGGGLTGASPSPVLKLSNYYDNSGAPSLSHIDLYGGAYGFGVSSNTLNLFSENDFNFMGGPNYMMVIRSGNLGIGTTAPSKKLDVAGDINLTGTIFSNGTSGTSGQVLSSTGTGLQWVNAASVGGTYVFSNGLTNNGTFVGLGGTLSQNTNLTVGDTSVLFINATNGRIGINTTNPSTVGNNKLDVHGAIASYGQSSLIYEVGTSKVLIGDIYGGDGLINTVEFATQDTPRLTINSSGNVGIGTTNPAVKLQVSGTNPSIRIGSNTSSEYSALTLYRGGVFAGALAIEYSNSYVSGALNGDLVLRSENNFRLATGGAAANFTFNSTGNLGLGTTNPLDKLDISSGYVRVSPDYGIRTISGSYTNSISLYGSSTGAMSFISGYTGSAEGGINFASGGTITNVRIDKTGNVGIGTTAPSKKLDIAGDINLTGTIFSNGTSGTSGQVLSSTGTGLQWVSATGLGQTYSADNGLHMTGNIVGLGGTLNGNTNIDTAGFNLNIGQGNTQALFISSNGNVGIGTTNPGSKLSLGSQYADYRNRIALFEDSSSNYFRGLGMVQGNGAYGVGIWAKSGAISPTDGNVDFMVKDGGNVGIGTTNPAKRLEIASSDAGEAVNLRLSNTAFSAGQLNTIEFFSGTGTTVTTSAIKSKLYAGGTNGELQFWISNNTIPLQALTIGNSGLIGIGTTSPTKTLDVAGDINLTGTIFSNGTSGTSGQVLSSTGTGLQWINASGVGQTYSVTNGLTMNSNVISLGGTLTQNTQIGTSNYNLSFIGLGGTQSLFVNSAGFVSIGTTAATVWTGTHISASNTGSYGVLKISNVGSTYAWNFNNAGGPTTRITQSAINNSGAIAIFFDPAGNSYFNNGNVGVGTTAPGSTLDVNGTIRLSIGGTYGTLNSDGTYFNVYAGNNTAGLRVGKNSTYADTYEGSTTWIRSSKSPVNSNSYDLGDATHQYRNLYVGTNGYFAGNVGIGTTDPTQKLDINGSLNIGGSMAIGSTQLVTNLNADLLDGLHASSFVAVGTTGSFLYTAGTGLTLSSTNVFSVDYDSANLSTTGNKLTTIQPINTSASPTFARLGLGSTSSLYLLNVGDTASFNNLFASGNIGIGTTAPSKKLDVTGDINLTGTIFSNGTSGTSGQVLSSTGTGLQWVNVAGIGGTYTATNGLTLVGSAFGLGGTLTQNTNLTVGNTSVLFLGTNGNVGIGTTNPLNRLDIQSGTIQIGAGTGNTYATRNNILVLNRTDFPTTWLSKISYSLSGTPASTSLNFELSNGASTTANVLTLQGDGNIGIGTTSPTKKLDITGDINLTGTIFSNGTSGTSGQVLSSTGTGLQWVNASAVGSTYVFNNGLTNYGSFIGLGGTLSQNTNLTIGNTSVLFLGTNGNVGIGTTSPTKKLDIAGDINQSFTDIGLTGVTNSFSVTRSGAISSTAAYGHQFSTTFTAATDAGRTYSGTRNIINVSSATPNASYAAMDNYAGTNVAGTRINGLYGSSNSANINTSNAIVTDLIGLYVKNGNNGVGATATNSRGIWIDNPSNTGQIINNYGLYINALTSGVTLNYAIYTNAGLVRFGGAVSAIGSLSVGTTLTTSNLYTTGNVGIGTTAPSKKLDIVGDINLTGTIFSNGTSGTSGYILSSTGTGLQWISTSGLGQTYTTDNGLHLTGSVIGLGGSITENTRLNVGNTEVLYFSSAGNVGIGMTNPLYKFTVSGTQSNVTHVRTVNLTENNTTTVLAVGSTFSEADSGRIILWNDGTSRNIIGVNATSPQVIYIDSAANINATQSVGIYTPNLYVSSNGRVGINTTDNTAQLTVNGDIVATKFASIYDYSRYYLSPGNASSNSSALSLHGNGSMVFNTETIGGTQVTISASSSTRLKSFYDGFSIATNVGSTAAGATITWSDSLFVKNNGNVGIGMTAPSTPLHVSGAIRAGVTSGTSGQYQLNLSNGVLWSLANTSNSSINYSHNAGTAQNFSFYAPNGINVGIGTTSPNSALEVNGSISLGNNVTAAVNKLLFAGSLNSTYYMAYDNAPGGLDTRMGGTSALFIKSNTNVGIGTTNPTQKLDINGSINIGGSMTLTGSSIGTGTTALFVDSNGLVTKRALGAGAFTDGVGTTYGATNGLNLTSGNFGLGGTLTSNTIVNTSGFNLIIGQGNTQPLFISAGGIVGIGTTNPLAKLQISSSAIGYQGIRLENTNTSADNGNAIFGVNSQGAYSAIMYMINNDHNATGSQNGSMKFSTYYNGAQKDALYISNQGNVGIGITNPLYMLNVGGTTSLTNLLASGNVGIGTTGPTKALTIVRGSEGAGAVQLRLATSESFWWDLGREQATGNFYVIDTSSNVRLSINQSTGNVGIGTTSAATKLEVFQSSASVDALKAISKGAGAAVVGVGDSTGVGVYAWNTATGYALYCQATAANKCGGNQAWYNASDRRLKENVAPITNSLSKVMNLQGVTYNMINDPAKTSVMGFIAQDALPYVPEVVGFDSETGYYGMQTSQLTALLVNAVQEVNTKLDGVSITPEGQVNVEYNVSAETLASLGYQDSKNEIESAIYSHKINTGFIKTINLVTQNIIAETTKSKIVKTDVIAPLDDITDTIVIDGNIKAKEASFSTVYADKVISKEGEFGQVMTDKITALRDEIRAAIASTEILSEVEGTPSAILAESTGWTYDVATSQVTVTGDMSLTDNLVVGSKLIVVGDTQLGNAFVTGTFTAGEIAIKDNFIETTNTALYIQPSGLGSVNLMNNALVIAENGEVTLSGNLTVGGNVGVSGSLFASLINADEINTKKINVATDSASTPIIAEPGFAQLATSSAQVDSNAAAGIATLPAGKTELIINNTKITPTSIVYLTPAGSTNNQVVYLKSKTTTGFTIAIDQALPQDIDINWWIIN